MAKLTIVNNYEPRDYGARCDGCPADNGKPVPPRKGDTYAVLGEYQGFWEEKKGRPLAGDTGQIHSEATMKANLPPREYIDNVMACRRDGLTRDETAEAVKRCSPRAISMLPRDIPVLLYGNTALQLALGNTHSSISDYMGVPFWSETLKRVCLPSLSPAAALKGRDPAHRQFIDKFVSRMRLVLEDTWPTWIWPDVITNLTHTDDEVAAALEKLETEEYLGLDVETPRIGRNDEFEYKAKKLYNVGFSSRDGLIVSLDWLTASARLIEIAKRILTNPKIKKVMQGGDFDYRVFVINGIYVAGFVCDTLRAFRIAFPGLDADLGTIAAFLMLGPRWKDEFRRGDNIQKVISFTREGLRQLSILRNTAPSSDVILSDNEEDSGPDIEEVRPDGDVFSDADPLARAIYNGRDCFMQIRLWFEILPYLLETHKGWERYENRMEHVHVSLKMWEHGVGFSRPVQKLLTKPALKKLEELTEDLREIAYESGYKNNKIKEYKTKASKVFTVPFNPQSNHHIKKLYLETWGVVPLEYSEKTGEPSYDAKVLEAYCEHPNKQVSSFSRLLKKFKEEAKLFGTYIKKPPVWSDDRLHPVWKAQHAITLRYGSEGPNLQNIPQWLRALIVKKHQGNWLTAADYSALQFRIVVMLAKDDNYRRMIVEGVDIHKYNAAMIFRKSEKEINDDLRQFAKTLLYAVLFDAGVETVHAQFLEIEKFKNVERDVVHDAMKTILGPTSPIKRWQHKCVADAKRDNRVIEPYTGHVLECHGQVDHSLVINWPVQTREGGYTGNAILAIDKELDWSCEYIDANQHDSIWIESPCHVRATKLLEKHMPVLDNHEGFEMYMPVETKTSYIDYYHMSKVTPDGEFVYKGKNSIDAAKERHALWSGALRDYYIT